VGITKKDEKDRRSNRMTEKETGRTEIGGNNGKVSSINLN
jgi:hypothetical protein